MSENELNALARALAALTPAPAPLNRDVLMFEAGRASAPRSRFWPLAAVASSLLALGFGLLLALRSPNVVMVDRVVVRTVVVPAPSVEIAPTAAPPASETTVEAPAGTPYQKAQDQVLRWGLDALPSSPTAPPTDSFAVRRFSPF